MDYAECLASCIATLGGESDAQGEADIATLSGYPVPSSEEWTGILARTAEYDDVDDPFACMAQYEMRLADRGIPTVLASVVSDYCKIAARVGLPRKFLADAIALLYESRSKPPRVC